MINNKYRMIESKRLDSGEFVYRIQAISKFRDDVEVGDYGGWIQSEKNLSPDGSCWVADDAMVINGAMVTDHATVSKNARVEVNAIVSGEASVTDNCLIAGSSRILELAKIGGNAMIRNAIVQGAASVYGNAVVHGSCIITDTSKVYGDCKILGDSIIRDSSEICGNVSIVSPARISSYADIKSPLDYWFLDTPVLNGHITMHKCKPMTDVIRINYYSRTTGIHSFHSIESFEKYVQECITPSDTSLASEQLNEIVHAICAMAVATVLCGNR